MNFPASSLVPSMRKNNEKAWLLFESWSEQRMPMTCAPLSEVASQNDNMRFLGKTLEANIFFAVRFIFYFLFCPCLLLFELSSLIKISTRHSDGSSTRKSLALVLFFDQMKDANARFRKNRLLGKRVLLHEQLSGIAK